MPFCSNCGAMIEEGSKFCQQCGARQGNAPDAKNNAALPVAPRKKPAGKIIAIIAAAAAVVCVGLALVLGGVFQSPCQKFCRVQRDFLFDPLAEGFSAAVDRINNPEAEGSQQTSLSGLSVSGTGIDESMNALLADTSLISRVDMTDQENFLYEMELNLMGSPLVSLFLARNGDSLRFSIPTLDSNYYGLGIAAFTENNADLVPEGFPLQLLNAADFLDLTAEEAEALVTRYADILLGIANKNNVTAKTEVVSLFDGEESQKCKVYTLAPTEEDYKTMLTALQEALAADEQVKKLYVECYMLYYEYYDLVQLGESLYSSTEAEKRAAAEAAWERGMADFKSNIDAMASEAANAQVEFSVAVSGDRVYEYRVASKSNGSRIVYNSWGGTLSSRRDSLKLVDSEGCVLLDLENDYTRSGKTVKGRLCFSSDRDYADFEGSFAYSVSIDSLSGMKIPYGEYVFALPDENLTVELTVAKSAQGGSDHSFTITVDQQCLKMLLNSSDAKVDIKEPAKPVTDITNYTEEELAALMDNWGNQLKSLLYALAMSSYGG